MQLTFEPVINKIGNDYFVVPKNDSDTIINPYTGEEETRNVRCVIKCDENSAYLLSQMTRNLHFEDMVALMQEHCPNESLANIEEFVTNFRAKFGGSGKKGTTE